MLANNIYSTIVQLEASIYTLHDHDTTVESSTYKSAAVSSERQRRVEPPSLSEYKYKRVESRGWNAFFF